MSSRTPDAAFPPGAEILDARCPECGDFTCLVKTGEETARCHNCGAELVATHFVPLTSTSIEEET